ncbi:MAG: ABC transporter ATP-binding protein [Nitrospinae bacterium]|nr:ABC transporter ATP-binding protein [Nitrospinota bacterium]
MTNAILQLEDVCFAYDRDPVVKHLSMRVEPGEFIGILGPNGSGKSTLLKLLGGILKHDSGNVKFREKDLHGYKRKVLAQSIAWLPQEHEMVFPFRVAEIILMGRHPYLSPWTFEGQKDFDIADRAMRTTETTHLSERQFNEISGGEKQRVMMACAIAQEPEVMLLDEPTTALDIKYQLEILNILLELNRNNGMTLILAMHDLHLASKYCRRLILIDKGNIVKDGTPEEVLQKGILETVYGVQLKILRDPDDGSVMISPESPCIR